MVPPAIPYMDIEEDYQRSFGFLEVTHNASRAPLPLTGVSIEASVSDLIAHVSMRQTFRNPYRNCIEATYTFPLAPGGAVSSFTLKVGNRVVKGVVQERQQARHNYQQAIQQGKRAAMLEQERDDVFTVQVGNLPPGEQVSVEIKYSERLPFFEDGKTEMRLPMVVAPRYMPGAQSLGTPRGTGVEWDTTRVADASRISPPRVAPYANTGVDLKIGVTLFGYDNSHMPEELSCTQHAVRANVKSNSIRIALAHSGEYLNRDFVLRWSTASNKIKSSLLAYTDYKGETYGVLSLMPPTRRGYIGTPRDVLFVVDRSGSMEGLKMVSAIRACALLLNTLGPRDRFAIQSFDNTVNWMSGDWNDQYFIPANMYGIAKGEAFLRNISARGGTELDSAMYYGLQAFASRSYSAGRAPTLVLLTDGQVGNESEILRRIQYEIGDVRLFTLGIDSAVNTGLLKRLANLGGGTATFVQPGQQLEEALAGIAREIGQPLVTDLQIHSSDLATNEVAIAPERIADVFAGRASVTFVKLKSNRAKVLIKGRFADGRSFEERVQAKGVPISSIAQLWAKARVVDLEDQYRYDTYRRDQIKREIIHLAVRHTLLTKFTAFLAIDHKQIVNPGGWNTEVTQPAETPDAWQMSAPIGAAGGAVFSKLKSMSAPLEQDEFLATSTRLKSLSKFEGLGARSCESSAGAASGAPAPNAQPSADEWGQQSNSGGYKSQSSLMGQLVRESQQPKAPSAGSYFEASAFGPPQAPAGKRPVPPNTPCTGRSEIDEIRGPLEAFLRAFEQAFASIYSMSGYPAAAVLEQLRQRLLQMLAPRQLGTEMPLVQRFLRSSAIDLIASLESASHDLAALKLTWLQHSTAFEAAKREAEAHLNGVAPQRQAGPGASSTGVFWEDSV